MNFRLPLSLLFSGIFLGLLAQESPTPTPKPIEEAEEPPPLVDIYFSVYVWPTTGILHEGSQPKGLPRMFYTAPTGLKEIPLSSGIASPLMPYSGDLPLALFDAKRIVIPPPADALPGTPPEIQIKRFPVVNTTFPREWKQVLLLVLPNQTQKDGTLLTLPMRYDLDRVRPGFIRIYNTTSTNLAFEVEGETHSLPANGPMDFRPSGVDGRAAMRVNFHGLDRNNEPRMLYTTRLVADSEQSNFFLLYSQDKRRLRLLRVGGHAPPPTPTPAPPSRP